MDLTHLTPDEKINGIGSLKVPNYLRNKVHGQDVRETMAQLAEMIIQFAVNLGLDPDEALEWARKLQESVSQSEFDSWVATLLDGGPSLFFETKAALIAKYPNGAPGVALVRETDPAKIYVWNGTSWEDFGDYQGIEIKDETVTSGKLARKAVTPFTTSFISNTNNLHNYKTDMLLKTLDGATGNLSNSSNNNTSSNKEVKPSTLYSIKYIAVIVEFDANFNFIRNTFYDTAQRLQKQSFTTQANTKIVRYSYPKEFANRVIFSEGDSLVDVEAGYLLPFFKAQDYVDKSIKLDKHVANLEVTNNLVNLGTEIKSKTFDLTTGAIIDSTTNTIVEKFRVKPATSYFVRGVTNVVFYDIAGAYISNWFVSKSTRYSTGSIRVSPDTAYTASVIFANDIAKSYIQMSESTKVEPLIYNQLIDKNRNYGVSKSRLFGKTLMSFGDSIAQSLGEFGYDDMIAAKYHMSLLKHGRGGATIGKITSDSANHTVQEQIDKAIADGETADYIIFNGGTNDYGTIGSITSGYTSTLNLETFCGAFENVIRTLRNAYPRAKIVYTSAHKMSTRGVTEKGELYLLAYEICKKYGIPCADIFFESQMDTNFENMKLIYGRNEGTDGTHPNTLAYEEHYVPIIESKLNAI